MQIAFREWVKDLLIATLKLFKEDYYTKEEIDSRVVESTWDNTKDKPFESLSDTDFSVDEEGVLSVIGGGGSSMHNYSLTEQVVGTWIDNKPLYEKTFYLENRTTSGWHNTNININVPDIETLVKTEAFTHPTTDKKWGTPQYYVSGGDQFRAYVENGYICITAGSQYPQKPYNVILTIQYTKTTD